MVSQTTLIEDGQKKEATLEGTRSFDARTEGGTITFNNQFGTFTAVTWIDGQESSRSKDEIPLHDGSYRCDGPDKITLALTGDKPFTMVRG